MDILDLAVSEAESVYTGIGGGVVTTPVDNSDSGGDISDDSYDATATTASVSGQGDISTTGIALLGVNPGDALQAGSILRITVARSLLGTFVANDMWLSIVRSYYGTINLQSCGCLPIAPFVGVSGDSVVIIDVNVHDYVPQAATVVNNLNNLAPTYVSVVQVELLGTSARATALSPTAGAAARQVAKVTAQTQVAKDGIIAQIESRFETLGTVAKWGAVIIIVGAAMYFLWPHLKKRS